MHARRLEAGEKIINLDVWIIILLFLTGETEWGPSWILGVIQLEGEVAMGGEHHRVN